MQLNPRIFGIVNITDDSFSDGGKFLDAQAAIAHSERLHADGAHTIDLGAASSNPDASTVSAETEINRLEPVIHSLKKSKISISIDSFSSEVQRFALRNGIDYINDILGFADPGIYPDLAGSNAQLIVMHCIQEHGRAIRAAIQPVDILDRIYRFFDERISALTRFVSADRLILDPGMGFFLSTIPDTSFLVLKNLNKIQERFGLPVLVSVSRKSFIGSIINRPPVQRGAATLTCEMIALENGASSIRTHDVAALVDALKIKKVMEDVR